ncbi:Protein ALP1-like [Linum perenne]
MNCRCFQKLCQLLVSEGGLRCSWNIEIDEMVAIFLYTIAHNEKNRILQVVFRRSGETISRVIQLVLIDVLKLHKILYRTPKPIAEDSTEPRRKYFKNCLGALDGTLITLRVPKERQQRYHTRKGTLVMNVLGVCNSDMEFIYTLAGWEGSAHDGRVLRDALIRPNGLKVSKGLLSHTGHYYLCDAGYSNCEGFLAPYQGQRYHLKEWGTGRSRQRTPEELFNMRHSSARNTIERAFDILKMRWAILRDTTWFSPRVVGRIVNACCLLHNFIRVEVGADVYERLYRDQEQAGGAGTPMDDEDWVTHIEPTAKWIQFRQDMAQHMWDMRGW